MFKNNQLWAIVFSFAIGIINYLDGTPTSAADQTDKDGATTKHFDFPLVHVRTIRHKDGSKDVDVRAPFTQVHNPAGPNNAQVKAPFTKVENGKDSTVQKTGASQTAKQKSAVKKQQNY
jgi:hypothetical protein